ncbi:glutathione S-transferase family protein [Hyalangium rubrum]|uniref:Glutathione S-transferase family protein n=1 Tax=Hyalangium rubrum TaxID=3103134 RepID=A0ABU5H3F7_9BACT|nr:glutathione S-transferase family protein [Hyalangium sp. s54d21]MDY7228006.1 glutathione S-transferase family protein [Hyalangium sp. s54d21]
MKLYHHPFSSAAFKVRALIHELGLPCEMVTIDMSKGEHKMPDFIAKNPNGKVPVLEDDGLHLWESNAILCYLAAKKPESGLMPTDPKGLAQMHQWLQWHATTLSPSTTDVMMQTVYVKMIGREKNDEQYAAGMEKVRRDLAVLENALAGKEYLCGKLSIADFSLVSSLQLRTPMGFDFEAYPNVKAWVARMEARESVRKSLPPQ